MEKEKRILTSQNDEVKARSLPGMPMLILILLLLVAAIAALVRGISNIVSYSGVAVGIVLVVAALVYIFILFPILCCGLKILKPNEAYVFTLFGKYYGTLKGAGYYFVNPFVSATNPGSASVSELITEGVNAASGKGKVSAAPKISKKVSLKAMTLNNGKQKINDEMGNPIEIGIVVIWRVVNTAKAVFNVENYSEYLSMQCDSALRNTVRLYPYDAVESDEASLRGSSQEIADKIKAEIQTKVDVAGLEVMEARITHLAYAPEIAAAMLQRQQASAIIDARKMIVDGAVGMVEMALNRLNEIDLVDLDEERKAAMVSNLLVVLCGNKDPQPIVNSGSLY
jgi:regulator of protease activity HflC (stomatin/prohibitin superfamily)